PVADVSVSLWLILSLGGGVGLISGLFGVGGGFLLTPLLIMSGIAPAVAVATQAPQIVASAFSGVLAYGARSSVDYRMGALLLSSGLIGSWLGVQIFEQLQALGQVEFVVTALYVALLGFVGALMARESIKALGQPAHPEGERRRPLPAAFEALPWKMTFPRSQLTVSVIPPLVIGFCIGVLGAIMGVGGGFVMVPAMIYLLGFTTTLAIGTSLFQITLLMAGTTVFHASATGAVDALLAFTLLAGGVIGAQLGAIIGGRLRAAALRFLLAILVLGVGVVLALNLVLTPEEPFSVERASLVDAEDAAPLAPPSVSEPEGAARLLLEAPAPTEIDLWFDGAEITVSGAVLGEADAIGQTAGAPILALRLIGAQEMITLRRKDRRYGMWLNVEDRRLIGPSYFAAAASDPAAAAAAGGAAPAFLSATAAIETDAAYEEALLRLRGQDELYANTISTVALQPDGRFEARFTLPPSATAGLMAAQAALIDPATGAVLTTTTAEVVVKKVGVEGVIAHAATTNPLLYSLLTLIAAIAAGWLAHAVFGYIRHLVDLDEAADGVGADGRNV
ncbi:MAG: TIGR02186 family protein, partial [Pseudomonadota bacterium]